MSFALFFGMVPPLILLLYIHHLDRVEREPFGLVLKAFIFGMLSTIPAVIMELIGEQILGIFTGAVSETTLLLMQNFLVVAFSEEFCKQKAMMMAVWKRPEFNYRFDAVLYTTASALGFAAAENILYLWDADLSSVAGRLIPVHTICGVFMGISLGNAKSEELRGGSGSMYKLASLLIPIIIHGFYDFSLSSGSDSLIYLCLGGVTVLTVIAFVRIRRSAKMDAPLR